MDYYFVENGPTKWHKREILIVNEDAELPTDVPAGSVAYTADLSYMAIFDGETWVEIGGGE